MRATAGAIATDERAEDRSRAPQCSAREIRDLHAGHLRRTAGRPRHAEHACERDVIEVMPGALDVRPGLTEAADRAHDDLRIAPGERRVADAKLVHHAGTEALDDDVRAL